MVIFVSFGLTDIHFKIMSIIQYLANKIMKLDQTCLFDK